MLLHHPNARGNGVLGGGKAHRLALPQDLSAVCAVDAEEDIHEGGFARAVFSQQRVDLALFHRQVYMVVGVDPGKGLADLLHFKQGHIDLSYPVQRRSTGCTAALWMFVQIKFTLRCSWG